MNTCFFFNPIKINHVLLFYYFKLCFLETFLRSGMEFDCRSYYMTAKEIGKVSDLGHVKEALPLELESLIQMVCENIESVIAPSLFFGKQ